MSPKLPTRRQVLWEAGGGLAGIALAHLFAGEAKAARRLRAPGADFNAKAKNIIMVFLPGGISAIDTFDYKPALIRHHGQETQGKTPSRPSLASAAP